MSARCLHLALRDDLRTYLPANTVNMFPLPIEQCEVTEDGRPLPAQAEIFVAIWGASWTNAYDEGIHEEYATNVTVSYKGGKTPTDRWGPEMLIKEAAGLDFLLELLRKRIHSNYVIMNAANVIINSTLGTSNGFIRPLFFRDGGSVQTKSGSWWTGRGKEQRGGLSQTQRYAGCERVQTIESQT